MTHLRIGLILSTILLIVACTAKLQQNSSNNSNSTKKETLATVSAKDDSIITALKERDALFGESVTNYTYIPPRDTPAILKKDNPIWQVANIGGRYEDFWRLTGGAKDSIYITHEEFMQKYLLPNIGISSINELRYNHKSKKDENGIENYYYTQYYKGLPTVHVLTITTKNSFVLGFKSYFDPTLQLNIVPTITEQQALDSIKVFLAATDTKTNFKKYWGILDRYQREDFPYKIDYLNNFFNTKHTISSIIYWNDSLSYTFRPGCHLVYLFEFGDNGTKITVDPFTGKILTYYNGMH